jgi:hypothetical protein
MKSTSITCLLIFLAAAGCQVTGSAPVTEPDTDLSQNGFPSLTLDPAPKAGRPAAALYGFSQGGTEDSDPQVFTLDPTINMRAWQRWNVWGNSPSDFNTGYITDCHDRDILIIGGGTASVVFREEGSTEQEFLSMITRDATGAVVPHNEIVPGAYRASMASPVYRDYLVRILKIQIDLGIDGLFLDEADCGGYNGGPRWGWNGNEGFDNWTLTDFNRWLLAKYPGYSEQDWIDRYGMTDDNVLRRDVACSDLTWNFNYREYLKANGWQNDPHTPDNPLAAEWGRLEGNRLTGDDSTFLSASMRYYWGDIIGRLRSHARETYGRELLITSNGLFPWVDYNSFGLYNGNRDDHGSEADYVPVQAGRLEGTKSLMPVFRYTRERHKEVAGDVPLVLFLDWPCAQMNRYYALPASDKTDFWKIYTAEAYACGLYYALHLKSALDEPTSSESGIMDFMEDYGPFYKNNAALFTGAEPAGNTVTIGKPGIVHNLMRQDSHNRYLLHLVNHNYNRGMTPQTEVGITVNLPSNPSSIRLVTPDGDGLAAVPFAWSGGAVTFTADLKYYNIFVIGD